MHVFCTCFSQWVENHYYCYYTCLFTKYNMNHNLHLSTTKEIKKSRENKDVCMKIRMQYIILIQKCFKTIVLLQAALYVG